MKRTGVIGLIVLLILILAACGGGEKAELCVFMQNGTSEYSVVYPLVSSQTGELKEALDELKTLTRENAGNPFSFESDYLVAGTDLSAYDGSKEILIGAANRKESLEITQGLREHDYVICIKDGKLVIAGGSDEATARAVRAFSAMFFSQTQTSLILEETFVYQKSGEYPISALTIDGAPVKDYTILYDDSTEADALFLQNQLRRLTGYTLSLSEDGTEATHTMRFTTADGAISCKVASGQITFSGETSVERNRAVAEFVNTLGKKSGEVTLDASFSLEQASGVSLSVYDLNLYSTGYGENSVNNRYPRLVSQIESYQPTILALQDVSPTWLDNIENGAEGVAALTDKYGYVGLGRNNDEDSVMQAIFYDKALYTLKDSGTFWLSETPEWESVGWDGRTRSICTWAILTETKSGKDFVVMNTRLDPYGTTARINGMNLILSRAEAFDLPVLLCGDMQSTSTSKAYAAATAYAFANSESIAAEVVNSGKTANYLFGTFPTRLTTASDFVMTSFGDFTVETYKVVEDRVDNKLVSNHWAIFVEATVY